MCFLSAFGSLPNDFNYGIQNCSLAMTDDRICIF